MEDDRLFRCSLCEKEFDEMPPDGVHTVHAFCKTGDGEYVDADGECGPVYEVEPSSPVKEHE